MSNSLQRLFRLRTSIALFAMCFIGLIALPSLFLLNPTDRASPQQNSPMGMDSSIYVDPGMNSGGIIMPKLGNETAKAELGRATWKLLHTMASRYPENPKPDEKVAIKQWIFLLSRLYPCGECASHFQLILKEHPPQTSSRASISNWSCSVHNIVNARLGKPEFDCSTLADVYKCGCADEPGALTDGSNEVK